MATWTQTELTNRTLEVLGIKALGQAATSEDFDRTYESITALYNELRRDGLAPFDLSTIPEWAQVPFRDIAAADSASFYGMSSGEYEAKSAMAKSRLYRQTAGDAHDIPIPARYF
jgi:hypothetical protein